MDFYDEYIDFLRSEAKQTQKAYKQAIEDQIANNIDPAYEQARADEQIEFKN